MGPVVSGNMQRIPERSSIQVLQVSEGGGRGGYLGQKIGRFVAFFLTSMQQSREKNGHMCTVYIAFHRSRIQADTVGREVLRWK